MPPLHPTAKDLVVETAAGVIYRQLQPSSSEIALAIAYQPREISSALSAF